MPIIKIYSSTNPTIDPRTLSKLTAEYFNTLESRVKVIYVQSFALHPPGIFVEVNGRKYKNRTEPAMQEYLKELEAYLDGQGYPSVKIRVEFFPTEDVHGVN